MVWLLVSHVSHVDPRRVRKEVRAAVPPRDTRARPAAHCTGEDTEACVLATVMATLSLGTICVRFPSGKMFPPPWSRTHWEWGPVCVG